VGKAVLEGWGGHAYDDRHAHSGLGAHEPSSADAQTYFKMRGSSAVATLGIRRPAASSSLICCVRGFGSGFTRVKEWDGQTLDWRGNIPPPQG
jgi:hypothetical protein